MQDTALSDASSIQEFLKWIVLTAIGLSDGVMDLWQKFLAAPVCVGVMLPLDFQLLSWQQMDGFCVRAENRRMFQEMVSPS